MSKRLDNIRKIEKLVFGKVHNGQQDATFVYINDYLSNVYFGDKGYEWNEHKMMEECGEVMDAMRQLDDEIHAKAITTESLHHVIEEIGDWILAASSTISYDEYKAEKFNDTLKDIITVVNYVNDSLYCSYGSDVVTVDAVFESNKTKLEEYASAYKTYEEVQKDEFITNNPLARIIRMLYTKKDLRDPKNKDKIIKELRRMRFAIVEHSNWNRGL